MPPNTCQGCGHPLLAEARFCPYCGEPSLRQTSPHGCLSVTLIGFAAAILASMLGGVVAFLFPRTTIAPSAEIRHKVPAVVEIEPATALRLTPIVDVPALAFRTLAEVETTLGKHTAVVPDSNQMNCARGNADSLSFDQQVCHCWKAA